MFIKKTKNPKGHIYLHLAESYREDGKVKQRILLSLGKEEDGCIDNLAQALANYQQKIEAIDYSKDVDVSQTYILGPLLILEKIFKTTGIGDFLSKIQKERPKMAIDLFRTVFSLVVGRWIKPGSKLAHYEKTLQRLYPLMFEKDIELQWLYRTLDVLAEEKDRLETFLYRHERNLFNQSTDLVFYDLTTLRFESTRQDQGTLPRFGYSKERRVDCTQVVFGLLMDENGKPLGFEVFPGNTNEGKTLPEMIKKLDKKFQIRRLVFVADRGILSEANLQKLEETGYEFIVGAKLTPKYGEDIYEKQKYFQIKPGIFGREKKFQDGRRLILMWSEKRADRDKKARNEILGKIEKKLKGKKRAKDFITHTAFKKYLKTVKEGEVELNREFIEEESKKDGFFGIITNSESFTPAEVILNYKNLWKIEANFGEFKGTLKARPIFHWTDKRIIGHLTLCFMALVCESHFNLALKKDSTPSERKIKVPRRTWGTPEIMDYLNEVRVVPVKIKDQTLWIRTDIEGAAAKAFFALQIKIPGKILAQTP